jgi:hypothetical protein
MLLHTFISKVPVTVKPRLTPGKFQATPPDIAVSMDLDDELPQSLSLCI